MPCTSRETPAHVSYRYAANVEQEAGRIPVVDGKPLNGGS
jgi:hypothetical protein